MKKETHFRIVELPEYQVLLTRDFDPEHDDHPVVAITYFIDGLRVDFRMTFNTEKKRDDAFNKITPEELQTNVDAILNDLTNLNRDDEV